MKYAWPPCRRARPYFEPGIDPVLQLDPEILIIVTEGPLKLKVLALHRLSLFVKGDVERPPFIVIGFVGVQVLISDEMRYRSGEHVRLWLKNLAQKPVEIRSFLNYTRYKFKAG